MGIRVRARGPVTSPVDHNMRLAGHLIAGLSSPELGPCVLPDRIRPEPAAIVRPPSHLSMIPEERSSLDEQESRQ